MRNEQEALEDKLAMQRLSVPQQFTN